MNKQAERKKLLGLLNGLKIIPVELDGHTHPHVLGALLIRKKIALLQSLEAKVVKDEITILLDHGLLLVGMLTHEAMVLLTDGIGMMLEILHTIQKRLRSILVVIVDDNARRKLALVGVVTGLHRGTGLRRKLIELRGLHAIAKLGTDLLGYHIGVHMIEAVREGTNPAKDLVERNGLRLAISLDN